MGCAFFIVAITALVCALIISLSAHKSTTQKTAMPRVAMAFRLKPIASMVIRSMPPTQCVAALVTGFAEHAT